MHSISKSVDLGNCDPEDEVSVYLSTVDENDRIYGRLLSMCLQKEVSSAEARVRRFVYY